MPGDIADEDISPPEAQKMAAVLQKLHARYGVFSATGNHEYYGGLERNLAYLRQGKVMVLMDEAIKVGDSFYVIGRKDLTARQFGERRKPLAEILEGVDPRLPLILLDHQPVHLEEAEQNGIDLQLSGHTHNGQLFPLNLINKFIYEDGWGYLRKGKTQYYVSCGVGTWGPPMRTASVPEIVQISLKFR
jgi:predicted MPP superfamily phosphohydrolase